MLPNIIRQQIIKYLTLTAPKNGNKKVTNPNNQIIEFEVVDGYSEIIDWKSSANNKIDIIPSNKLIIEN